MTIHCFYAYWQLFFCAFAFAGLIAIYWHIGRKQKDRGQVWLALSVLCWSVSGGIDLWFCDQPTNTYSSAIRSILSLVNSLFILLALPSFRYIPKNIEGLVQSKNWKLIVGVPFLFCLLPSISGVIGQGNNRFINELDLYYALLTLLFLGSVLWSSFQKRKLPTLAWLSIICILITLIAQILKLTKFEINEQLFSAIFKSCLIMLFFALALSWVKELMENIIPPSNRIYLTISTSESAVLIGGIGNDLVHVQLSKSNLALIKRFSQHQTNEFPWLEIQPKQHIPGKSYDINDHNQVKRLLHNLLDGIFGKGAWTQNNHYIPLKDALFEMSDKRDRRIRLRIPVKNINHK